MHFLVYGLVPIPREYLLGVSWLPIHCFRLRSNAKGLFKQATAGYESPCTSGGTQRGSNVAGRNGKLIIAPFGEVRSWISALSRSVTMFSSSGS